jgi:hypothetical protein
VTSLFISRSHLLPVSDNKRNQVVVVTPRIFITIPSGQSMEYGTMELPPRVIRQLVTQQVRRMSLDV